MKHAILAVSSVILESTFEIGAIFEDEQAYSLSLAVRKSTNEKRAITFVHLS